MRLESPDTGSAKHVRAEADVTSFRQSHDRWLNIRRIKIVEGSRAVYQPDRKAYKKNNVTPREHILSYEDDGDREEKTESV
jgi:hypothetical protein